MLLFFVLLALNNVAEPCSSFFSFPLVAQQLFGPDIYRMSEGRELPFGDSLLLPYLWIPLCGYFSFFVFLILSRHASSSWDDHHPLTQGFTITSRIVWQHPPGTQKEQMGLDLE